LSEMLNDEDSVPVAQLLTLILSDNLLQSTLIKSYQSEHLTSQPENMSTSPIESIHLVE